MNRTIGIQIILIISLLNHCLVAQNWQPTTATITFKIKHAFGATAEGEFKGFLGSINLDRTNLTSASIKATIDVKTISTNIKLRDNAIRGKEYFSADEYPRISMVSTKIEKTIKQNEYIGYFSLTIKNVTKNIKFPFIFTQVKDQGVFTGNFTINRTDFGIGEKSFLLGNATTIYIKVNTQQ
ncbi:MAG: YceI family protein [Emticicia sp.]|nr:YceI family protein [Emticicia sp.]